MNSFPSHKYPDYDLITAEITSQLPKNGLLMLKYILIAIIHYPEIIFSTAVEVLYYNL